MAAALKLDRKAITKLLESKRWTGVALAEELGISRTWFIELRKGKRELKHTAFTEAVNAKLKNLVAAL